MNVTRLRRVIYRARGRKGEGGDPGKSLNWREAWQQGVNYAVIDAVYSGGSSYVCKAAHLSAAETQPGNGASWRNVWTLMAQKGDPGTGGGGEGDVTGPESSVADNFVSFADTTGKALQDSGKKSADFEAAGAASASMQAHTQTYDHNKLHDPVTAGAGIGISANGQQVSNTDKGSDARAAHEIAFAHDEIADNTAARHEHNNKAELDKIVTAVLSVAGKTGVVVVTKSDVGLSNVVNALQVLASEKGAAGGVAPLGPDSKIATEYLNPVAITNVYPVASEVEQLALEAQSGDVAVRSDLGKSYIHNGGTAGTMADWTWLASPTDLVLSVNGKIGTVVLAKADVGLGNVDNTQQVPMSYLDTDGALTDNSDSKVPSQQAVKEYADTKSPSNHNHNLADLTEKSYNSLTDKPTIPNGYPKYLILADQTSSPNNANWAVNALAPIEADDDNAALTAAAYVHTAETGRGLDLAIPSGATNIAIAVKGRAKTAPATAKQVVLKLYSRGIPDNAAVEAWSAGTALTALDIPTNEYYQYDSQTIALATLGLTAGRRYQFELTRTPAAAADTLDATWYMGLLEVNFS